MADYDLGRARGRIIIDFDDKGTQAAQEEFSNVEEAAEELGNMLEKLSRLTGIFSNQFGDHARRFASAFGLMAGGAAILLGLSRATGVFRGSVFRLRGVLGILGSLGLMLGGLPRSVQGFPKIIKQIIMLSAAIGLFAKSSKLLNSVFVQLGRFIGGTKIIQKFTSMFPGLTAAFGKAAGFIPSLTTIGKTIDGWGKPIHKIASMALAIGSLITLFRTGTKVAVGLTKAILKIGLGAIVIQGLVFIVGGLIDALSELSGALGLIPGILAVVSVAAATVKIGMQGFADAMKNMDDAAAFEKSLQNLAPTAQDAARSIRGFRDDWDRLRRSVQNNLFAGISSQIEALGRIYLPLLQTRLSGVATQMNLLAQEAGNFFQKSSTIADVNLIFDAIGQALYNLRPLVQPILQILTDIFVVSAQVFAEFTGTLEGATVGFADFIREARESGKLAQWIRDGITAMYRLGDTIVNIALIFKTVFAAFDSSGEGFLLTINKMTDRMLAFLQSAEGQEILNTFVDLLQTLSSVTRAVLGAGISELGPIIKALLPFLKEMATTISAVLVVAIKILGPILKAVAEALSAMAPVLGPIVGFFLAWSIATAALSAIFSIVIGVLVTLVSSVISFYKAMKVLGGFLVGHPLFAALLLLGTLAYLIISNWEVVGPKLKAIWDWIAGVATTVWNAIRDFFVGLWQDISGFFVGIWNSIANFAVSVWTSITDFFVGIWDAVSGAFEDAWNGITGFLSDTWNALVDIFSPIFEPLVSIAQSIFSIVSDTIYIIFGTLAIALIWIWDKIKAGAIIVWTAISDFFTWIWSKILEAFHFIWDPLVEFFSWIWDTISTAATEAWTAITEFFTMVWNKIMEIWHTIWDPIAEFFTTLWNSITEGITNAWNAISDFFSQKFAQIRSIFDSVWTAIGDFWNDIWNSKIVMAVRNGISSVLNWIGSLPGKIWDKVKDAGRWLWDAGRKVITGFFEGLKDAFRAVADWVGGIADWVRDHKGPLPKDKRLLVPAGQGIMEGLLQGLMSREAVIKQFLTGLTDDISNGIGGANVALGSATDHLAASATLGIVSSIPSNAEALASSVPGAQMAAKGTSTALAERSAGPAVIQIQNLELKIAGNLDPTNPVQWREAIKSIKESIRKVEKDYPNG